MEAETEDLEDLEDDENEETEFEKASKSWRGSLKYVAKHSTHIEADELEDEYAFEEIDLDPID